ncbi:MAG: universal stress protein [Paenibacillus sp. RIFOXYA1_FULL_44_5]|nr:MAG: universal stress protein [Paenibacillus sp. RIFOXYA1_FULL_44_5]
MKKPDSNTVELDVRPYLRKKLEPFQLIMDTVKTLTKESTLILHTTFIPKPLLTLMKTKGYVNQVTQVDHDHWTVTFIHKSRKHELEEMTEPLAVQEEIEPPLNRAPLTFELDNRGLEPPQPMIRTLKKLEEAQRGDTVIIHNDRIPLFLIEELNDLGCSYQVEDQSDGSARVRINKL